MTFDAALGELRRGRRVKRAGWKFGQALATNGPTDREPLLVKPRGPGMTLRDAMTTSETVMLERAGEPRVVWPASAVDMRADDWRVA